VVTIPSNFQDEPPYDSLIWVPMFSLESPLNI